MAFLWPHNLWLLAILPLAAVLAFLLRARRERRSRDHLRLLARPSNAARWLPPALFVLALVSLVVAAARPAATISLPAARQTIILALDVSGSMSADDVWPSRLAAAQAAAREFVAAQPPGARLGVVAFSDTAQLVQAPSERREDVVAAIDRLQPQQGTAIGKGILVSLKAIFPQENFDADALDDASAGASRPPGARAARAAGDSAAIVLLTDGQNTEGPGPVRAARLAAERGVRVYTVGIGTTSGEIGNGSGWSMLVGIQEEPLKSVAEMTRGEYFYAGGGAELKKIYAKLGSKLVLSKGQVELGAFWCAAAAIFAVAAAFLSLVWFGRIV